MHPAGANAPGSSPAVALLPWGDLFEDWLDPLGIDVDTLRDSFAGSWMFGWADALRTAGVRTSVVAVTSRVTRPTQFSHRPTGASIHLLPPPRPYRVAANRMARESRNGSRDPRRVLAAALAHAAPYAATPLARLRSVLRSEGCRAIVSQEYETPRFDAVVALGKVMRVPVFATFQGGDYHASRLERFTRPSAMRAAAGFVIAPREEAARIKAAYRVDEQRIARIFNPVDTVFWRADDRAAARRKLGWSPELEVVAWHGQLHPRKGLDALLAAWAELRLARPDRDLRLVLVGSGEQDSANLLRGHEGVQLIDEWITDRTLIRQVLSAADVYAFPSRHEGFPVAPIEAMACGLPVVATAAQGVRDIFEHGELDGGIVLEVDDVRGLAEKLGLLLDDPRQRQVLGERARARVESSFALESVGRELRTLLLPAEAV